MRKLDGVEFLKEVVSQGILPREQPFLYYSLYVMENYRLNSDLVRTKLHVIN